MANSKAPARLLHASPVIYIGTEATLHVEAATRFVHEYWGSCEPPVPLPDPEVMKHAQRINPCTIVVVADRNDEILGIVEMYALNRTAMRLLLSGEKLESQIELGDLESYNAHRKSWDLYVAILCPGADKRQGQQDIHTLACLMGSVEVLQRGYLNRASGSKPVRRTINLYGLGVTPKGRSLADKKLGFKQDNELTQLRRRNHETKNPETEEEFEENVFHLRFTAKVARELMKRYKTSPENFDIRWSTTADTGRA